MEIAKFCNKHGMTIYVFEKRGYYRCKKCRSERVSVRRRKIKELLVEYFGGCCIVCGYNRCIDALEFHHLDDSQKSFALSAGDSTKSFSKALAEAKKCALVCANCHRELESGLIKLSETVSG